MIFERNKAGLIGVFVAVTRVLARLLALPFCKAIIGCASRFFPPPLCMVIEKACPGFQSRARELPRRVY